MFTSAITFIIIFGTLILVHEMGHFLAAKKQGVKVEEFGFGMPPRIFGYKIGETIYSINLIPLGGFVRLYGEEYHEVKKKSSSNRAFVNKKPWQKAIIVLGGVIGNFLLGWGLISFLFTQGVPVPTNDVIVEKIVQDSPAQKAGFAVEDKIKKIMVSGNYAIIDSPEELNRITQKYAGQPMETTVLRNNREIVLEVTARKNPPPSQGPLGIVVTSYVEKKYSLKEAPFYGLVESLNITKKIAVELMKVLIQLVSFQKPQVDVAGPIGIARFASSAIKFGKNAVLELVALLSFNLAIVNILPFPALDGGRLVFVIYEWVTKRRPNQKIEKYANMVGLLALLTLGILISINDIIKIYK